MPRRGTALTHRGWSLLGAAFGLLVAGRLLGTPELTTLGLCAGLLIAGAALWTRSRNAPVRLTRMIRPARVHVGGEARVDLELVATAASPQLTVTDSFEDGLRAARFLTPALDRAQRARAAYRIPTDRRGRFSIGPAVLGISDPFGLTVRVLQLHPVDEVTVRPRVHELRTTTGAPGQRRTTARRRAVVPVASPAHDEFLALRDYEVGDDLRRIHWRSSARFGELLVREDESAWQPRTILLLDNRAGAHSNQSYEAAIEAVASIGLRWLRSGRACEITTTAGHAIGQGHAGGVSNESRILDELAVLQPDRDGLLGPALARLRSSDRRGLFVVVTGSPPDLATFATLAGPGRPVVLVACGDAIPSTTANVRIIDGRPGMLVHSWNTTMTRARDTRRRGVSA